jgi:hypothetical protein
MKKRIFLLLLLCGTILCLGACNKENEKPPTVYDFNYYSISSVDYEILLGTGANVRIVRIPLIFDYETINDNIACEIESIDGENLSNLQLTVDSVSFTSNESQKYLISNINVKILYDGNTSFLDKTISEIKIKFHNKEFAVPVNILIKDRSTFGIYRNLNKNILASENQGTIDATSSSYREIVGALVNTAVDIEKIVYPDQTQIEGFHLGKYVSDEIIDIDVTSNLLIEQSFNNNETFSAYWNFENLSDKYCGKEKIIIYKLKNESEVYVDSYFTAFCFINNLMNLIVE